jgi:hypothetical protein
VVGPVGQPELPGPIGPGPARSDRYRRQQRRRAVIGWAIGALAVGLFVVGAIAAGDEERRGHERPNPFGYSMTTAQYEALRPGLEEQAFVNRLEQTGLPENLTTSVTFASSRRMGRA